MQRNQWVIAGTAGVLSVGVLSLGALGVANALEIRDASGTPLTSSDVIMGAAGDGSSDPSTAARKPAAPSPVIAPTPTTGHTAEPASEPVPVPIAPVTSVPDEVSAVSAPSGD